MNNYVCLHFHINYVMLTSAPIIRVGEVDQTFLERSYFQISYHLFYFQFHEFASIILILGDANFEMDQISWKNNTKTISTYFHFNSRKQTSMGYHWDSHCELNQKYSKKHTCKTFFTLVSFLNCRNHLPQSLSRGC